MGDAVAETAPKAGSGHTSPAEVFISRQPIFDAQQNVFGYELLFPSSLENVLGDVNPDQASAKVITDSAFLLTLSAIGGGKRVFINITRDVLVRGYIHLLPIHLTAAEVLQTVEPDPEVLRACRRLKETGYLLVLGDFALGQLHAALMEIADIVKVDFLSAPPEKRRGVLSPFQGSKVRFLAEKLETQEEFKQAAELGYSYFQGQFFSKPVIISGRDVPANKLSYLRMLKMLQAPGMNFLRMESVIKQDMALTFKLLRCVNSAYFGLTNKVTSILHAMMLLGPREFKQWASLLILARMGDDKPDELVKQGLSRALFCESLAPLFGLRHQSQEIFLLGMFSLMDAILGRPLEEIAKDLPLTEEIKAALLGKANRQRAVLEYAMTYEKGEWEKLKEISSALNLQETGVRTLYEASLQWAQKSFEQVRAAEEAPRIEAPQL
jgi:EAL and modified HD-GYP domain-containing signal transduction protein